MFRVRVNFRFWLIVYSAGQKYRWLIFSGRADTETFYLFYLFIYNAFLTHSKRNLIHMIRDGVAYNRARLQTRHAPNIIIIIIIAMLIIIIIIIVML